MTRAHDMGGRYGDGAVKPEPEDGPVFPKEWHARALAVTLAAGGLGKWNIDTSRHARECLSPQDYTRFTYYEKWISALADLLVSTGEITRGELQNPNAVKSSPLCQSALKAEKVSEILARGGPANRDSNITATFEPGQAVTARRPAENQRVPGGHTRLPAYVAGATGRVLRYQGTHVLPDSNAHGLGEAPEPLYAVAFPASQLWAHPEHPDDEVILDLWQSYLSPA